MSRFTGVFIEADPDNINIYTRFFELEGVRLMHLDKLPPTIESCCEAILKLNANFLIIDCVLDKQVRYKGLDLLKEIRKYNSTIPTILLTNYELEELAEQYGKYNYELIKSQIDKQYKEIVKKIKDAIEAGITKEDAAIT